MKSYFYLLFLLSLSLAAQNKGAQKRLYYNLMDNGKQLYAMGKYKLELFPYEEAFDTLVTKRSVINFAKKNHFSDTIPKKNPKLAYPHYYLSYYKKNKETHWQNTMVYFIGKDTDEGKWSFIATISSVTERPSEEIDTEMIRLILDKKVLNENHMGGRSFDFLGRKVMLMDECYWTGVNIVRCPTKGEMNWSLYPSLADAQLSLRLQKEWGDMIPLKPNYTYNCISDQQKTLIFEGKPTQVTEVIYNVRYQDPILKSYYKDNKLIVYYIATIVRGQAIACVISYWDYNERLPETGLPEFVSQFVRLPKGA
ncbi:hypothetical protein [Capnocytophaga sp. oral taxon 338]|uniref:hypothetical protein n=1 Tax=Capnocytophaga sp. oral taxon 338 TaxID=710239 RepID=UPI000202FBBA|nr:hypothetical protein [Capnocytophaga sp. oral taxon 338]EGD33732.1 hypothetical protein HMPREF9071_1894 [Capnocytophaga sp. oral taxon 338 str. F0234]